MEKKAYIFLANGFEEVEALTVVDLLRRANVNIKMVSISGNIKVTGSHGIVVDADLLLEEANCSQVDALILPGGMPGTRNLENCDRLVEELKSGNAEGRLLAAICAAPLVLGKNHLLEGKKASCYPGFEEDLLDAKVSYDPVSVDGNTITSRGLGTAIAFSAAIISKLVDEECSKQVLSSIIYNS